MTDKYIGQLVYFKQHKLLGIVDMVMSPDALRVTWIWHPDGVQHLNPNTWYEERELTRALVTQKMCFNPAAYLFP